MTYQVLALGAHLRESLGVTVGEVQNIVIEEMQKAWPMSVPLIADCGWGDNWLQAH